MCYVIWFFWRSSMTFRIECVCVCVCPLNCFIIYYCHLWHTYFMGHISLHTTLPAFYRTFMSFTFWFGCWMTPVAFAKAFTFTCFYYNHHFITTFTVFLILWCFCSKDFSLIFHTSLLLCLLSVRVERRWKLSWQFSGWWRRRGVR